MQPLVNYIIYGTIFPFLAPLCIAHNKKTTYVLESVDHNFSSNKKLIHVTPHFTVVNTSICISATSLLLTNKKMGFYPLLRTTYKTVEIFLPTLLSSTRKDLRQQRAGGGVEY